ncbi:MAG: pentapeptide repeat-containing protein [Epsilonproteobacteria bacterium]|nr:pentapeptide repeat-containing protein [Campylobacterota bacterium]
MKKTTAEKIAKVLPNTLKNTAGYLKSNFDKSGQETLTNATGTVAVLVKLFAQDTIDGYFDKLTKEKLEDFGASTYLKASLIQVGKSLEALNEEAIQVENVNSLVDLIVYNLNSENTAFSEENILTIFTPQYHPIVVFVKEQMEKILYLLDVHSVTIKSFTRDFNENIESTIIETFGSEDYEKHKEEVKAFLFKSKESKLLWDMYALRTIGFKENESLKYEETFAQWQPVSKLFEKERTTKPNRKAEEEQREHEELETSLQPIENLIEEYFNECTQSVNCLKNILFTIADFGKGKSVFLRQYASRLAKAYTETKEGYFPIYFNLRNFANYSSDGSLGVIASFLLDEYSIRIDDEEFSKKKYIFLIDSLDESGELTKSKIEKVIASIQNIQNIDREHRRDNRVIVTSRPFSEGLEDIIKACKPHSILDENGDEIAQYISLYGFKEEQFNAWLYDTLKSSKVLEEVCATGFAEEILESIKQDEPINIYQKLLEEKTLSREELRRPIFAYMIYQLITHNIDFLVIGKIGVYLSFINLLTKEAKYIGDKSHQVNHTEEIHYRNILHSIASLWMYERQQGKQGILNKADICRVLDGENRRESDREILERYKNEGVTELQFLSHSYFGEEDNNLHFQHQSFAEILLAEYYLKVFIKYALDKKSDIDTARSKLVLGEPTEQTVEFFKELIRLLKETATKEVTAEVIEKRKLLYPLLASLATEDHNTLYSSHIDLKWFDNVEVGSQSHAPTELLEEWAIGQREIEKIMELAVKVIDSKTTLMMAKTKPRTALFDEELTIIQNAQMSDFPPDMDKWLALVIGNLLHDDIPEERRFFNGRLECPDNLSPMIGGWRFYSVNNSPKWAGKYFKGFKNIQLFLRGMYFKDLDFSYSIFTGVHIVDSNLRNINFSNCIFQNNVSISNSDFRNVYADNWELQLAELTISTLTIARYAILPEPLLKRFGAKSYGMPKVTYIGNFGENVLKDIFYSLNGLLIDGLKNNLFDIPEIKSWFDYETNEDRKAFEKLIDGLVEELG